MKTQQQAKPFLKWAGGKSQILSEIRAKYPADLGVSIKKYAEPFVGGGAVLFDVLSNYSLDAVYISDINRELLATYNTIRDNVNELVSALKQLEQAYHTADTEQKKILYYNARNNFNDIKKSDEQSLEIAALFIFLNRTCFNGLYRVNSKGGFNVPQGSYKKPSICDESNIVAVSQALQNVEIVCGDYTLAENFIDDKTFAYFDPPYRPLSTTASFTSYAQDGFDDDDQMQLANFIDKMSERGAYIVASNSDPKNTNEADEFFDNIYAKHSISRIEASRAINSVAAGRGKVRELLIASV
ncbi:MAG: DNA adenine methylase [Oscillospiraceae bacterium]|nr:DNA adenine methylase [Oscillospiraceae bacterium]